MKGFEITLRSGTVVTVDATDVTVTRNKFTGELTAVDWVNGDEPTRKLMHVRVEEIAAVVVLR